MRGLDGEKVRRLEDEKVRGREGKRVRGLEGEKSRRWEIDNMKKKSEFDDLDDDYEQIVAMLNSMEFNASKFCY